MSTPPKPTRPRDFPEFRNAIVDDDEFWRLFVLVEQIAGRPDFANPESIRNIRSWLEDASLWWIGEDACELVQKAAPSMPPATLTKEFVPQPNGFVCWERPLTGVDARSGAEGVRIDFTMWLPNHLKPLGGRESLSLITWRYLTRTLEPLGRADWPLGDDTDTRLPGSSEVAHASIVEDRKIMAALWQLSSQPNITDIDNEPLDRHARRRIERSKRPIPDVRVVTIPTRHRRSEAHTGASEREYSHRWIVSPHWRQVPYGPGRSLRRPRYILPYVAGPEDKPLIVKDTVRVWKGEK